MVWPCDLPGFPRRRQRRSASTRAEVRAILRLLGGPVPGATVLHVSCGIGGLTPFLAMFGTRGRIGVATSPSALRRVRRGLDLAVVADVGRLPFPEDSVDLVLCTRLHHDVLPADERRRNFRELARVARAAVVVSFDPARSLEFRRDLATVGLEVLRTRALRASRRKRILVLCRPPFTGCSWRGPKISRHRPGAGGPFRPLCW